MGLRGARHKGDGVIENHMRDDRGTGYLLVVPNQSLSWHGNKVFIAVTGAILLTLAVYFALYGLWLIVPFAGLELAGLWAALYYTSLRQQCREVIRFTETEVVVQRGRHRPRGEVRLPRHWSRFIIRDCGTWAPKRLWLRCHDRQVELAARLGADEKECLIGMLREITGDTRWQNIPCRHDEQR
jgi:uncharacterized membrane protein